MKLNSITKLLSVLIGYSLLITSLNVMMLGTINPTFFPTANYFVIALVWLYRGFDSLLALGLGVLIMSILLVSFIKLIIHKKVFLFVTGIYLLDLVATIYLLANGWELLYALSVITDVIVALSTVFVWKRGKNSSCKT